MKKSMVDLSKYKDSSFPGVIVSTKMMILKEYLGDNLEEFKDGMKKFPKNVTTKEQKEAYKQNKVESTVLTIIYEAEIEGKKTQNKDFFNIPSITGFSKSKLSSFREDNNLPWDTAEWEKKPIKTYVVNGFLKLFPEAE